MIISLPVFHVNYIYLWKNGLLPYDAPHIPLNYRLLRYADVLLMYAEVEKRTGT